MAVAEEHAYCVTSGRILPNEPSMPSLARFDEVITDFMREQGIPGAALALSLDGKPVYRQGYGIAGSGRRAVSSSMFRIASISKPLTAIGILKLCENSQIQLTDKVFGLKGILSKFKPTKKGDARIKNITVQHLLEHSAGWDRDQAGDPVFWKLQLVSSHPDPASNEALVQFMMTKKLQFSPGRRHAYSNFGYLVLGLVIEAVTGQSYGDFIQCLLRAIGISRVHYFHNREPPVLESVFPQEGLVAPQYGSFYMENTGAYGGLVASAVDLVIIMDSLNSKTEKSLVHPDTFQLMLKRPPYENGAEWYGLGFDVQDNGQSWGHTGAMEGTSTTIHHHRNLFSWALLFNAWSKDMDIDGLVKYALSTVPCWPLWSGLDNTLYSTDIKELVTVSADSEQLVKLLLPHRELISHINELKSRGYYISSVNASIHSNQLYFNLVWTKNSGNIPWFVVVDIASHHFHTPINTARHQGYKVTVLESYVYEGDLQSVIVFKRSSNGQQVVHHQDYAKEHLKKIEQYQKEGMSLVIQSAVIWGEALVVSSVYEPIKSCLTDTISWLQITAENFQYELNKQTRKQLGLVYVKFYTDGAGPSVSAIWSSAKKDVCLQRHNASRFGFLYELRESAKLNRPVEYVCSYENEGVINFAAIWKQITVSEH